MKQEYPFLFVNKRTSQSLIISIFISVLSLFSVVVIGYNNDWEVPTGFYLALSIIAFAIFFFFVFVAVDEQVSFLHENRYLSEKDILRLDDLGKSIVRDFLEKSGGPITESQYDSIRGPMISREYNRRTREQFEMKKLRVLSSQKKALDP